MSQLVAFAFATYIASEPVRTAVSAWLNVTFWHGKGVAATITGLSLAASD